MEVPMAMGRPKAALVLSPEQRAQLESMASSRSLPAGLVTRARIVLLSAAGKMNQQIARQLGLTNATVGKWRRRFVEQGVAGLHDELRPGRPRPISDERVAQLVRKTLETKPKGGTHWSVRPNRRPDPPFEIHGAPHLAGLRAGAAPAAPLQALDRSDFRGEGARHRGTVLASAGERGSAVCGREEPDSGAGTHPAHAAHRAGVRRRRNPRLSASWNHDPVCRAGHGQGYGAHALSATASASRISGLSAADRQQRAAGPRRARDRGQLRDPQASACEALAGDATALSCALHSHLRLLAQSGGDLVQPDHATSYPPRNLSQRKRTGG